ncbi:MAG: transcriptional regulator [Mucilaginibacter sp.]|nr:transcriptional regulator [Mucilaginibacter sp.]
MYPIGWFLLGVIFAMFFDLFYGMTSRRSKKNEDPYVTHILEKVGNRLKALRRERGISNYEKFANELNISRSQIGRYEKGEDLKMSTLIRICQELEISLEEFFRRFDVE